MQPWGSFSHPWLQAEEWIPASYQPGKGRHTGGVQSRPADRRGSWGAPHEQRERAAPYVTVLTAPQGREAAGGVRPLPVPWKR